MPEEDISRDHLFISYAYEDAPLADWLVRKLVAQGYRVWCDRFKLLGGESYPRDIDTAIKIQTFRFIALLSRYSLEKPNPTKERTLALNIARERHEDFVIPLNVDGLRAVDLDWMTSDLTFIPFNENWASGLSQLLKKLTSLNAPRPLIDGVEIAANTLSEQSVLSDSSEVLHSNQLAFVQIPEVIRRFKFVRPIDHIERASISQLWPAFFIDRVNVLAFHSPRKLPNALTVISTGGSAWRYEEKIDGVRSTNVMSSLMKKEFVHYCRGKGLLSLGRDEVYFPSSFLDGKLHFAGWDGRRTWVQVVGQRSAWRANKPRFEYKYNLSIRFALVQRWNEQYLLQLRLGVHITDTDGNALPTRSALARRKAICRSWWNDAWLKRTMAICEFLADGKDTIEMGLPGERIVIDARPVTYQVALGIDEAALENEGVTATPEELDIVDDEDELLSDGESHD